VLRANPPDLAVERLIEGVALTMNFWIGASGI